jgi:hypothetical protein
MNISVTTDGLRRHVDQFHVIAENEIGRTNAAGKRYSTNWMADAKAAAGVGMGQTFILHGHALIEAMAFRMQIVTLGA